MRTRAALGGAALAVLLGLLAPAAGAASAPLPLPSGGWPAGIVANLVRPGASPPGANDFSCRPTPEHPRPVVLLHGFTANMTNAWQRVAPLLKGRGYCVFALTYGTYAPVDPTGTIGGLGPIQSSGKELAAYVDRVLLATGADEVDLVGWSEGGWLARQYIQFDGGAARVGSVVGLAPANGPTNISQLLFTFGNLSPFGAGLLALGSKAASALVPLAGQAVDPVLFARLNAGGGTSPQVSYTHIASRYDEFVPPSSAFVPTGAHVKNVVLQNGCPIDFTDHLSIISAPRAMGFLLNALDPVHATPPPCVLALPGLG